MISLIIYYKINQIPTFIHPFHSLINLEIIQSLTKKIKTLNTKPIKIIDNKIDEQMEDSNSSRNEKKN